MIGVLWEEFCVYLAGGIGIRIGWYGMDGVSRNIGTEAANISWQCSFFLCLLGGNLFKDSSYQGGFLSVFFFFSSSCF